MRILNYNLVTLERAKKDLKKMPEQLKIFFLKHFKKLQDNFVPGKHLKHGISYFVEKVTESTRFAFEVNENTITVVRCFKNHKEYEEWYKNL